jgi:hypothetical protein
MRCFLFASIVTASLACSASARAEFASPPPGEVAVMLPRASAPAQVAADKRDERLWIGTRLEVGASFLASGTPGGYGRATIEMLSTGSLRETGPVLGFWYGFEGWGAPKVGGGSVPLALEGGVKLTHFVATLGAGFNLFTIDKLEKRYGGGIFSPRASARIGLHFEPVYVVATADVQRRWQWGLDDMTVFQAGLAIGVMVDGNAKAPARSARAPSAAVNW